MAQSDPPDHDRGDGREPDDYSTEPVVSDRTRLGRARRRGRSADAAPRLPPRYAGAVQLGVGGMGVVYQAVDRRLDRPVAIKHLPHALSLERKLLRRFEHEAKAAARLSHPAIVQIYDLVHDGDDMWIVMELVPGRSLASHLAAGPLEVDRALALAIQIAGGIAEAHVHGIVHRDLKASNVMVTPAGHAKILDFGVAKSLLTQDESALTTTAGVIGTPHAMSPEQVRGLEVDARSDLFSFGSLLYQMVTGDLPFRGASPVEALRLITEHQPPPPRQLNARVPAALSELIESLIEKEPARRPRDARVVGDGLERIAAALATDP